MRDAVVRLTNPKLLRLLLFAAIALLIAPAVTAQTQVSAPVLLLSDIHLDPFHDPAKLAALRAAPVEGWLTILSAPAGATQTAEFAHLQSVCGARGVDTPAALFESSLQAAQVRQPRPLFVTISGDLLAHNFPCRFKTLATAASEEDYSAFAAKTVAYVALRLRQTFPATPVYLALGNNDSGCEDYREDPSSAFLQRVASSFAAAAFMGKSDPAFLRDFSQLGDYDVTLPLPHARLIVLQDIFASKKFTPCSGASQGQNLSPVEIQNAWLRKQLEAARRAGEHVWVMAHIPPGVDAYSTFSKGRKVCAGEKPEMFLSSETFADILQEYADTIRLALFGHTHMDELRLYTSAAGQSVPGKLVPSITPVNGNNPAFTLAEVDRASANLKDYTVFTAARPAGPDRWGDKDLRWTEEYRYSAIYAEPDFSAASLQSLIGAMLADKTSATPVTQAYERFYFAGDPGLSASLKAAAMQVVWPVYACSMTQATQAGFKACACAAAPSALPAAPAP